MLLRFRSPQISYPTRWCIALAGVSLAGLTLAGCGAGVSNALPNATAPDSSNIPSGPVLGYIFTPGDGTLRAMLGVRGSARVSASIVPAGVYVAGEASTASSVALLEDENGSLFSFNLPRSQPTHVADGLPSGLRVAFSPSGQTAVAYAPGGSGVTVVTGLPASPQAKNVGVSGPGRLLSAAVSDAGDIVVSLQGPSTQVGTLSASGQFSRIASVSSTPSFSFLAGSDDMLLADGGANTLALIHTVSSSPSVQTLSVSGLNNPVAVSASHDKHWAVVANGSDASVLRVDLATGASVTKLACACQPSQLSSLAGNAVFRVNSLGTGPVWTVDLAGATPQLFFVPAIGKTTP
jgi:hypothetical protein